MSLLLALLAGCSGQGNGSEDGEWDFREQSFTIEWGDGSVTGVEFDLYTAWAYSKEKGRRVPTVHSPIRVDGVERGEGYYDAWIVEIVR